MKNIHLSLYRITCMIVIFFFGVVFFMSLGTISHMEPVSAHFKGILTPLFLLSGSCLLLDVLLTLSKWLRELSVQNRRLCLLGFAGICIFLQLFVILKIRPCLQADALKPVDTALFLLKGGALSDSPFYEYFAIYPHNLPLTLYILYLFKLFKALGISESSYMVLLQLLNLLLLDLSLWNAYTFLKKRAGLRVSTGFALLCTWNPLLWYYPVFFYTQVLSMPIFLFLITLFFELLDADTAGKQIGYGILYGITLFFGWKIRFLTLITPIACAMYLFFHKREKKTSPKALALVLLSLALAFGGCSVVHDTLMSENALSIEEAQAFPVQHWLMMGLGGDGSYDYTDEAFTKAIPTKEARITETTAVIKDRLNELQLLGVLRLWGRKLSNTWADGYDDYASNLAYAKHSTPLNDWISGKYAFVPAGYLHIYNCMSWLLLLLCSISLLQKKLPGFTYAVCITILGGMMFHLLWEAGEQYSMPFASLLLIAAALGFDSLSLPSIQKRLSGKSCRVSYGAAFLIFVGLLISCTVFLTKEPYEVRETRATQNTLAGDYIYLEHGETLTQTFTCERPFNELMIQYKYYGSLDDDAQITLRLLDASGNRITEEILPLSEIIVRSEVTFDRVIPKASERYTIEITGTNIPEGCRGAFTAYHTGNWDTYPEGSLSQNDNVLKNIDLCFTLTDHTKKPLI